jgi:hypothetical protein
MTPEETQKLMNEILAKQRYAQLVQRMRNPKNRNVLDVLEYQSLMAQLAASKNEADKPKTNEQ